MTEGSTSNAGGSCCKDHALPVCHAEATGLRSDAGPRSDSGGLAGWVCIPLRLALGGLFLLAAYNKLFVSKNAPALFSDSIKAFKLDMPEALLRLSTSAVPWVELIAAAMLVLGLWTRAAAAVLGALLIVFIVLIIQALVRELNVECGCFGKLSPFCPPRIGVCNLIQNGFMLAAAALIVATRRHRLALSAT